jgi:hypothetical protein
MNAQFLSELALAGGLLLPVAVIVGIVFIRSSVEATIQSFSWKRKVSLERSTWVERSSYSGWPDGSRNHRSTIEVHQVYQVVSHRTTTTMINGQPVVSTQPVYGFVPHPRKKFLYEIQEWVKVRDVVASGEDRQPYWPEYALSGPDERVGETQETYQVMFQAIKGKRKIYRVTLPNEEDWAALDEADIYKLQVSLFGTVLQVQRLDDSSKVYQGN